LSGPAGAGYTTPVTPPTEERVRIPLRVDSQRAGLRADRFLVARIPRLSRSRARRIVAAGDLQRDGIPLKPASLVRAGDELVLLRTPPPEPPAPTRFSVLHDDGDLVVIDKPPRIAVHPTARYFRTTLTQRLREAVAAGALQGPQPRPCHRLDRETSGVLLLARSRELERQLKLGFQRGAIDKLYWALVEGWVERARFVVDQPLGPAESAIRIKMGPRADGQPARTRFELLGRVGAWSLLACMPETGRTHQIRAHLACVGHPVVGDKIYGSQGESWFLRHVAGGDAVAPMSELAWPRQCLHARAASVSLNGERRRFEAPWPDDLPRLN